MVPSRVSSLMRPIFSALRPIALAAFSLTLLASVAGAGTLCGVVRDAATQLPVARAGVFVRATAGAYTGLHAATAVDGSFCMSDVPAGTYDLEIRVDNYLIGFERNVVVTDAVTGVDVTVPPPALRLSPPSPNPIRGSATLAFTIRDPGPVRLLILDARGRLVQGWESDLPPGSHEVAWDLRSLHGAPVPPGVYFARLSAGNRVRTHTLTVVGPR